MKISDLYLMLCNLYGIRNPIDIEHYLLSVKGRADGVVIGNRLPGREALIMRQSGENLEVGLYINPAITAAVESGDALGNIDALACTAEGVSHFLYVADRAARDRRLSRLEIELQGEVDKFLVIHLIASESLQSVPPWLFSRLFEDYSFDPGLGPQELERYATANHFAAKFCSFLRLRYFNPLRLSGLTTAARDFFERDLASKLKLLIP